MCVLSYSVCLKGPQHKCVCCWHSPFNIVWIFHQDPKPCYKSPLFPDLFVHSLCVCLQRHYRYLFSLRSNKVKFGFTSLCTYSLVNYSNHFFSIHFFLQYHPSWSSVVVWRGIPISGLDIQLQISLYPSPPASIVQGTLTQPWIQVTAGYRQSWVKGEFCVCVCVSERSAHD